MSSQPSTPSKAAMPEPSPQEARFFFSIIKNLMNKPDIDWHAVATDNNMKNAKVAATRFSQIKKKLGLDDPGKGPSPRTPKGKAATSNSSSPSTIVSSASKVSKPAKGAGARAKVPVKQDTLEKTEDSDDEAKKIIIKIDDDADGKIEDKKAEFKLGGFVGDLDDWTQQSLHPFKLPF